MRQMKQLMRMANDSWTDQHLVEWVGNVMIAVHVGLGVAILVGGEKRFTPPSYEPLIDLTNGRVWLWGIWILFSAGLMVTPFKWVQAVGLWLGMIWMIMWSALFAVALIHYSDSAATAPVTYAGLAMINASLLTAKVLERGGR